MAGEAPFERLVLAPEHVAMGMPFGAAVGIVSDGEGFRQLLVKLKPLVVVLFEPPASMADISAVLAERRHRDGLRAVLINGPSKISARLDAMRDGFDEAFGSDVDGRELEGRLTLLAAKARAGQRDQQIVISDDVSLDTGARELRVRGRGIHLRPRESALLEVFALEPGRTFSRKQLMDAVAGGATHRDLRTIDVHIRWLRAKLDREHAAPARLVTVRGLGYRLETDVAPLTRR